ncbi:Yip1 family protein [Gordonia caeni]|uniref:DUF6779 domain-containing protein n=1 Tax=Gordonia caeni TaxID=1007097 RepID=A0ABP7NY87_9ACTN
MASTDSAPRAARRPPRRGATQPAATPGGDAAQAAQPDSAAKAAAGTPGGVAQWLLGLFIVLALIASLLMVFGNDISITASLAVIAALWAAVIGAVLVTKYRRQADVAENRSRDLRLVYELQLEREIAARRQYESDVETAIRHELAEETNEEFEELKAQVLALRASLEQVLGNPLPEVPLALRPERRRELGSGLTGRSFADATDDRVAANLDFASTAPPADPGRHAPDPVDSVPVESAPYESAAYESAAAAPSDVEMTEIIPVVTDEETVDYDDAEPADSGDQYEYAQHEYARHEYARQDYAQPQYQQADYQQADYQQAEYTSVIPAQPHADYTASRYEYTSTEYTAVEYAEEVPPQQAYDAAAYQPPVPPVPEVPAMPQRGRRAAANDEPGAHTAGQPASELLDRLRQSRGEDTGGRRRRD